MVGRGPAYGNHPIELEESPMTDRITSPHTTEKSGANRTAILLPAVLFAVILAFAIVVTLRYAGGG